MMNIVWNSNAPRIACPMFAFLMEAPPTKRAAIEKVPTFSCAVYVVKFPISWINTSWPRAASNVEIIIAVIRILSAGIPIEIAIFLFCPTALISLPSFVFERNVM